MNNTSSFQQNCTLMPSYDDREDLISPETEHLIEKLKSAVIIPLFFLIGCPTNIINIVVFLKQGLRDRVNLCLFSLAVVDVLYLSFHFVMFSEQMFLFESYEIYGPVSVFITNYNINIFYSANYASMFLSAVIALDRCVCVVSPLQAKSFLKTKNMAVFIVVFVPLITFLRLAVTAKYIVSCVYDSRRQLLYLAFYTTDYEQKNKVMLDILDGIFYGFIISIGCPVLVLIATLITSIRLWQTVAWRKQASGVCSKKEIALTKMLILLSVEFLVFSLMTMVLRTFPLFTSDFSSKGKYHFLFLACISISEVCSYMASSLHFFVYYFAGSRYRKTIFRLFSKRSTLPIL